MLIVYRKGGTFLFHKFVVFLMFNVLVSSYGAEPITSPTAQNPWKVYMEWPFSPSEAKRRQDETANGLGIPVEKTIDLGNGVGLELVLIPAGRFMMGTPEPVEPDWGALERKIEMAQMILGIGVFAFLVMMVLAVVRSMRQKRRPQVSLGGFIGLIFALSVSVLGVVDWHQGAKGKSAAQTEYDAAVSRFKEADDTETPAQVVTLPKPFYMGKYEVTQQQYEQIIGTNPSKLKGRSLPVDLVSWDDVVLFCTKVGNGIRLPSEAEWEFACRAGTFTRYYSGDLESDLAGAGWYSGNSRYKTHRVGQKEANAFGLHDILGNVAEFCKDNYDSYTPSSVTNPQDAYFRKFRVLRNGSFRHGAKSCGAARRMPNLFSSMDFIGFRVVQSLSGL